MRNPFLKALQISLFPYTLSVKVVIAGLSLFTFLVVIFFSSKDQLAYADTALLSWVAPTTNTDGTTLTDLAGFKVYYGTSSQNYGAPVDVGNQTSYTVTALGSGTYYFSVTAYNSSGNESAFATEGTKTIVAPPPVISAISANNNTPSGATITWTTDIASNSQVEFGLSTSYGSSTALASSLITSHSQVLATLQASTLYHFRVRSSDGVGNLTISDDNTFITSTIAYPVISGIAADNVTSGGATITWTTDISSNSRVEYGPTTSYGSLTTLSSSLVTNHSQSLSGLQASTTYHFRIRSADGSGNMTLSGDNIFTTANTSGNGGGLSPGNGNSFSGPASSNLTPQPSSAAGGCGMIRSKDGKSPSPGQGADFFVMLSILLFLFARKKLRNLNNQYCCH